MKTVPGPLLTAIAGELTTKAHCWKITRRDGTVFFFTDHDEDLVVDGDTYVAAVGYQQTAIETGSDLTVNSTEITGYFDASALTAADLRSGEFDFADAVVFTVDWTNPGAGKMRQETANFGEARSTPAGIFSTEMRGMSQRLAVTVGDIYSPECRADLGDAKCTIDLGPFTHGETVTAINTSSDFTATNAGGADLHYYAYGLVHWLTGLNAGRYMEIKDSNDATGEIGLAYPMPGVIQVGDTCELIAGCDKQHDTCKIKFNNIVNRRAEDFIPGPDAIIQTPNAPPSQSNSKK